MSPTITSFARCWCTGSTSNQHAHAVARRARRVRDRRADETACPGDEDEIAIVAHARYVTLFDNVPPIRVAIARGPQLFRCKRGSIQKTLWFQQDKYFSGAQRLVREALSTEA